MLGELLTWGVIVALYAVAFAILQLEKHWYGTAQVFFTLATLFAIGRLVVWVWSNPDGLHGGIAFIVATFAIWAAIWFVGKVERDIRAERAIEVTRGPKAQQQSEERTPLPEISFELAGLNSEPYNDGVQYMLPRFKFKTPPGYSPRVQVNANLRIFDDRSMRMREFPGVWHRSKVRHKKFSSGDSGDLVLGLVQDKGMVAYEYNVIKTVNGAELSPSLSELDGKRFYVLVVFTIRTDKDILLPDQTQWFGVDAGPKPRFIGLLKQPSHLL